MSREREVTLRELRAWLRRRACAVLSFAGYSSAGYEDPKAMLAHARWVLSHFDAAHTLVNAGATAAGIGAVYPVAKALGFATMGVVSTQARLHGEPLSPWVDEVFFVADAHWGGLLPGSRRLTPTSAAMVAVSDVFVAIGGGAVARVELAQAQRRGVSCIFIPADLNHDQARRSAADAGLPLPATFRGAAHRPRCAR